MAKISALLGASALTGGERFPIVQGGDTRGATFDQFRAWLVPLLPAWLKGEPGAAGNVAATLAQLRAADPANVSMIFEGRVYRWRTGDFSSRVADRRVEKQDDTDLSIGAWVAEIEGNAASPDMVPAYVQLERGMIYAAPANWRTGLSDAQYAVGGGYIEELTIAVVGERGSKVLATAEAGKVAGLGGNPWAGALNAADGSQDVFVEVMSHNGSTEITLNEPLPWDFVGTLTPRHGDNSHLSYGATRAAAQVLVEATDALDACGAVIETSGHLLPPSLDLGWTKNAALAGFGESDSPAPIVQTKLFREAGPDNIVAGGVPYRPLAAPCGVRFGARAAGHGIERTAYLGRAATALRFTTGARRADLALAGVQLRVRITGADGAVLYDVTASHVLRWHRLLITDQDWVKIEVWNGDGGIYEVLVGQYSARRAGRGGRIIRPGMTVLVHTDSWGHRFNRLLSRTIAEKSGANVICRSNGGKTVEYFHAWHDADVATLRPDLVIRGNMINEYGFAAGAPILTFVDPAGIERPLWPEGVVGPDAGKAYWRRRQLELFARDQQAGARVMCFGVGGLNAYATSQNLADWYAALDPAAPDAAYVASPAELADPASYINRFGKFKGKQIVSSGRTLIAQGSAAAATWQNKPEELAMDALLAVLKLADFNAAANFTLGVDDSTAGGNAAGDGRSNGTTLAGFGTQTGHVFTYTVPGGRQRLSSAFSASGASSGNTRVGYTFNVVDDVEYLIAAKIVNATPGQFLDIYTDLPDVVGGVAITAANGNNFVGADGSAIVWYRAVAGATATKLFAIGNQRVPGETRAHDVQKIVCIKVADLLAAVPSQAGLSTPELAAFVLRLR